MSMLMKSLAKRAQNDAILNEFGQKMIDSHNEMVYSAISYGETIGGGREGSVEELNGVIGNHVINSIDTVDAHLAYGYTQGLKDSCVFLGAGALLGAGVVTVVKHREVIGLYTKQQLQKLKNMFKKESE